jgi:hypothetical protein
MKTFKGQVVQTNFILILWIILALFIIGVIYVYTINISNVSVPQIGILNVNIYNFIAYQSNPSVCSFSLSFTLNQYINLEQYDIGFVTSTGLLIIPKYNNYTITHIQGNLGAVKYVMLPKGNILYNQSICDFIAQSITGSSYISKISFYYNNVFITQNIPSIITISANNPSPNTGSNQYNTTVEMILNHYSNQPIAEIISPYCICTYNFDRYIQLTPGKYTLEFSTTNSSIVFSSWSSTGGVIISNDISTSTTMYVINEGSVTANVMIT